MEDQQSYKSSKKIFYFPTKQLEDSLNEIAKNAQEKANISE
jgi:hypothetical protein